MSSWKPKFKLAGKVITILRKRPNADGETSRQKANNRAGHDYSDIHRTPTLGSTLGSTPIPAHNGLQSNTSSRFGVGAGDSADVHPRYELVALCTEEQTTDGPCLVDRFSLAPEISL